MKRAKRVALLKLLRRRPINMGNYYSVAITPELATKLGTREWMSEWARHLPRQSGKSGMQREFINAELRKALKATEVHDLNDLPHDLTITFTKSTDLSEAARAMARKWLEENLSGAHQQQLGAERKNPLVLGGLDRLLGEQSRSLRAMSVRLFNSADDAIKDAVLHWKHPLMDQAPRLSEAVKEFGLAKALEYRSMPAKPEDYASYNVLSAINELEKDKDD